MAGGPCAEAGCCSFVGIRMICYACWDKDDSAKDNNELLSRHARCDRHYVEHRQIVHGVTPVELFCTGCRKHLGTFTDTRSKAGAPWCGTCKPWWNE